VGVGTEIDRIFTPIRSKTAQAVEVGVIYLAKVMVWSEGLAE